MALANFFDRAAMAASQILSGFDPAAFAERLEKKAVGLAFDSAVLRSPEGAATLDLSVRLLARLYPVISLCALDAKARPGSAELAVIARRINPDIEIAPAATLAACIVVGRTPVTPGCPTFFAGSDGWTALLSRSGPVRSGASSVPFGAGAAACLAAANVFRIIFGDQLTNGDPDGEIALSLLDYGRDGASAPAATGKEPIDLGETHLVGLGAIGNGAIWALSRCKTAIGTVHLVDDEALDLSNLQRYVLGEQDGVGRAKVEIAETALKPGRLQVVPHRSAWRDYVSSRGNWNLGRIAVAVDTAEVRIAIQGALPRWIVNAWTQDLDLGVSRHGFDYGGPCLACLYLPSGKVKDEDERLAEEFMMPAARMEIRRMLQTDMPLDDAFVRRVAAALSVPAEPLLGFVGQPLRALHRTAICGGLAFKLNGGATKVGTVVPMAFQSALAGILLSAELAKHTMGITGPAVTRINLLRPLAPHLHDPVAKDRSGRCICADGDFVEAYRLKYDRGGRPPAPAATANPTRPRAGRG